MAWASNAASAEFAAGHTPLANTGRPNENSVTLGGSLQADSDRWNGMSPHGVIGTAMNAGSQGDDSSFERLQRDSAGGYQPGSMGQFQDQIDQGSNDNLP